MTALPYSLNKLVICDPGKSRSFCHVFISHPTPVEEKNLGRLLLLAEITSPDKVNIDIVNTILEELKEKYYHTDDLHIETAFEKALEQVNQKISDMVGDYETNWLDKLNLAAVIISNDQIYLSYVGHVYPLLIRGSRIINILESAGQPGQANEKINPLKAFSQIISGNLQSGDGLVFCTPALLDYLSLEKIKRTVSENSLDRAIMLLENVLTENILNTAFAALLIKFESATSQVNAPAGQPMVNARPGGNLGYGSQTSMDSLLEQKTATNGVLNPSLSQFIIGRAKGIFAKFWEFLKIHLFRQSPRRLRLEKELRHYQPVGVNEDRGLPLAQNLRQVTRQTGNLSKKLFTQAADLIKKISGHRELGEKIINTIKKPSGSASSLIVKFKQLPRLSKALLLVTMVIVFALSQSIYATASRRQNQDSKSDYSQQISLINENTDKAEAAIIIGNEDRARELLTEAQDLLDTLPKKSKDEKETFQSLSQEITQQQEKTKHITPVQTTQLADLGLSSPGLNATNLILIGDEIITVDPTKKVSLKTTIASGKTAPLELSGLNATFQYILSYNNNIIFMDAGSQMNELNIDSGKISTLQFSLPTPETNFAALANYENRTYFLDIKNSQIYRASRSGSAYSALAKWVKDDTQLNDASSITIDGNIYILIKDGRIIKMTQGLRQDWSADLIDPALTRGDKIWTTTGADSILVQDRQNKRLIEFNKNGRLVNQYTSENFSEIKDFDVDYAKKTVYVLVGNIVSSFSLL